MALTTAAAATAATFLGAMYLDAKLQLTHDLTSGALANVSKAAINFTAQRVKDDRMTLHHDLEFQAKSSTGSANLFLMFEGRSWTYRQFFNDVQRVGNWLMNDLGIQRGEVVALNGTNSPEYLLIWFAMEGIGAIPAFMNCNLTAKSLLHCASLTGAKRMLADEELRPLVEPSEGDLKGQGCEVVYYDASLIAGLTDSSELPRSRTSKLLPTDTSCLMFTSGTTGLPKAIKKSRAWAFNTARGIAAYLRLKPGSRMYTCLPLYHAAAQGLCVTPLLFIGGTVVLSRKFSHKTLWPEVRESKAEILQYVGELCRYLINAPPSPLDKKHNVKMAWGNGMRPDVWDVFRDRFGVDTINELYAASDGVGGSFNRNRGDFGKFAIGRRGALWHYLNKNHEKRVKIDTVSQEILLNAQGFAIECRAGEAGEVVIRMDPATEKLAFPGYYNNEEASEKRKIRGLFEKNDVWFRTGDMMKEEEDGCVYFVDRLGDTFRWKSENVSTNEVGDVAGVFDQVAEANVYGVQVPFADGRCGCAALVLVEGLSEQQFDFDRFAKHNISALPRYAVPVFLRIMKELQYTGTMKLQKGKLREEGIDLDKIVTGTSTADSMYWFSPGKSTYVPFDRRAWEELKNGKIKL